jgi:HSP20 family protein
MPGVKPEDVEITAQQDTLSLKWETRMQVPEGATVHWHGFGDGQYQQAFTLPSSINADRAEASTTDGVLTLTLPKAEHARARKLSVTAKK